MKLKLSFTGKRLDNIEMEAFVLFNNSFNQNIINMIPQSILIKDSETIFLIREIHFL